MRNLDELRNKYNALSTVKVPDGVRERVHNLIQNQSKAVDSPKSKWKFTALGTVAAALAAVAIVVGGAYSISSHTSPAGHPSSQSTGQTASSQRYLAQKVSTAYGIPYPTVITGSPRDISIPQGTSTVYLEIVDPRYDDPVTKATVVYNITLLGNFKKGDLHAGMLTYKITPDANKIWNIVGYDEKNRIVWQDSELQAIQ
jgi:hypothetical protein